MHSPRAILDLLLKYAISEDAHLHAEKYYRTASEEFAAARPAFRWRQLVALARVTASEYGQPAQVMPRRAGCFTCDHFSTSKAELPFPKRPTVKSFQRHMGMHRGRRTHYNSTASTSATKRPGSSAGA